VDNLAKAVLDALRGIAWTDDANVVRLDVSKRWTLVPGREEEQEGARLTIRVPDAPWPLEAVAERSGLGCAP
jgi:Holliday junction resolvase RusA-like endonuclease